MNNDDENKKKKEEDEDKTFLDGLATGIIEGVIEPFRVLGRLFKD